MVREMAPVEKQLSGWHKKGKEGENNLDFLHCTQYGRTDMQTDRQTGRHMLGRSSLRDVCQDRTIYSCNNNNNVI